MSALTLLTAPIKQTLANGKCRDLVKLIREWDTEKRVEGMINKADRTTIRISNSSLFMENFVPFLRLLALHNPYFVDKVKEAEELLGETSVGLIESVSKARKTKIMTLLTGVFAPGNDEASVSTADEAARRANPFLSGDPMVDDSRVPEDELNDRQLQMRRNIHSLMQKHLNVRYEKVKFWMQCFFSSLSDPEHPETLQLIRAKKHKLFMIKKYYEHIPYLRDKKFTRGVTEEMRAHAIAHGDFVFANNVEEAWMEFEKRDERERKKADKDNVPYYSLLDQFWTHLNNLVLLCQLEFQITDESLEHLHRFFVDLWQEFMSGKIVHFREMGVRMMDEFNKAMPRFDGSTSVNGVAKFFLDALFHNRGLITQGAQEFQQGLDPTIIEFIKSLFNFDLGSFDLEGFVDDKLKAAFAAREKTMSSPDALIISPDTVRLYKQKLEEKLLSTATQDSTDEEADAAAAAARSAEVFAAAVAAAEANSKAKADMAAAEARAKADVAQKSDMGNPRRRRSTRRTKA